MTATTRRMHLTLDRIVYPVNPCEGCGASLEVGELLPSAGGFRNV